MDTISKWIIENDTKFYSFSILLSVPSTFVCICEIVTILNNKKLFGNSFFRLFCVRGISDILMMAASYYGNRLPSLFGHSLLPIYRALPNWSLALFYFLTTFTFQVTNIATVFILLNRLTAIAFPIAHKKIWNKFFWLLVLVMLAVPTLTCYPIMQMEAILSVKDDGTFVILEKGPTRPFLDYSNLLKLLTSIIFLIVCFLLNLFTLIAYKRHRQATTNCTTGQSDDIERKLLIYSLLTFAGHALIAIFFLLVSVLIWPVYPQYSAIIYIQYPWVTDLCTLVLSSWMLLCTSRTFRHQFVGTLVPKRLLSPIKEVLPQTNVVPLGNNIAIITVQPYAAQNWQTKGRSS